MVIRYFISVSMECAEIVIGAECNYPNLCLFVQISQADSKAVKLTVG